MHKDRLRILVCDDNANAVLILKSLLEKDYEIIPTTESQSVVDLCLKTKPDILLLDVMMPDVDGLEVCRQIRKLAGFPYLKILLISAKTFTEDKLTGYEAGADDYVTKPFVADELKAKLRVYERLAKVEKELHELNQTLEKQVELRTVQLLESRKLTELGSYSAGIVHNLKGPLTAILTGVELLLMKSGDNRILLDLKQTTLKMRDIISNILHSGARHYVDQVEMVAIAEVIENEIKILDNYLPFHKRVKVLLELDPISPFKGRYSDFAQVLANLFTNASDAMHVAQNRQLTVCLAEHQNVIQITVKDTGLGMSQDQLSRIYDPFFTTKPLVATRPDEPTGTGLGMLTVKKIVENYGGRIEIESHQGKGTTIKLFFPR